MPLEWKIVRYAAELEGYWSQSWRLPAPNMNEFCVWISAEVGLETGTCCKQRRMIRATTYLDLLMYVVYGRTDCGHTIKNE